MATATMLGVTENSTDTLFDGSTRNVSRLKDYETHIDDDDSLYYVPPGLVVLLSFLYGSISAVAVTGNFLVILVILKNKSMQTVTNFYIANLAVADVIVGIFAIPFQFQAALLQRWDLPEILCAVAPFVLEFTVNVSVFTLAIISLDRYMAVIYPLKPRCSRTVAKVVMTFVWIFSLGSGLPAAIVFRVEQVPVDTGSLQTKPFCYPNFPKIGSISSGKVYRLYLVIVQYFFPLLIISFAYFRIMHRIWGNKAPGSALNSRDQIMNKNKRKVSEKLLCSIPMSGEVLALIKKSIFLK